MEAFTEHGQQPPARMVAGALAHLARHLQTGCPRASRLAAMLLARVAGDAEADGPLRTHAAELVEILEREAGSRFWPDAPSRLRRKHAPGPQLSSLAE